MKLKSLLKEDLIPGGKGDNKPNRDFNPYELEIGIAVEMEHTGDPKKAEEIAKDHLTEHAHYYIKLVKAGLVDEPKALALYKKYMAKNLLESKVGDFYTEVNEAIVDIESGYNKLFSLFKKSRIDNDPAIKSLSKIKSALANLMNIFQTEKNGEY